GIVAKEGSGLPERRGREPQPVRVARGLRIALRRLVLADEDLGADALAPQLASCVDGFLQSQEAAEPDPLLVPRHVLGSRRGRPRSRRRSGGRSWLPLLRDLVHEVDVACGAAGESRAELAAALRTEHVGLRGKPLGYQSAAEAVKRSECIEA